MSSKKLNKIQNQNIKEELKNKKLDLSEYKIESEFISLSIVEKIISISLKDFYVKQIYKKVNEHCFNFIKNQINSYIKAANIIRYQFHGINNNKGEFIDKNTWVEIKEPESVKFDRYDSSYINFIKHNNIINEKERDKIEEIIPKIKTRDFYIKFRKNPLKKILNANNDEIKKKITILPFKSYDIPNIENEFNTEKYDVENIQQLRMDKMNQIIKKENEKKKQLKEEELRKKLSLNKQEIQNIKPLDSSKYTFDSNGTIFSFKKYKIDNSSKEFYQLENNVKTLYKNQNWVDFKTSLKKNNVFKKSNSQIKEKEKNEEHLSSSSSLNNSHRSTIMIKKNDNDKEIVRIIENNDDYLFKKISPEKIGNEIVPSGSNYKIILPSVGVNIKYEREKVKKGDKNFSKYFKKTTLEDYNTILKEFIPQQNHLLSTSNYSFSSNNINNQNKDYNNNNNNYTTINNSISLSNLNKSFKFKYYNTESELSSSNLSSSRLLFNQLTNRTIKLNPNIQSSSLKNEIENLANLNSYDERILFKKAITVKNIFKQKIQRNYSERKDMTDINIFNSKILNNKQWGKNINTDSKNNINISLTKPSKPNTFSLIREYDKNILNKKIIKLPRQRKINIKL